VTIIERHAEAWKRHHPNASILEVSDVKAKFAAMYAFIDRLDEDAKDDAGAFALVDLLSVELATLDNHDPDKDPLRHTIQLTESVIRRTTALKEMLEKGRF